MIDRFDIVLRGNIEKFRQNAEMGERLVRTGSIDDQDGIRLVDEAAIATLRQTYRPSKKAITSKTGRSGHLN